MSAPGSISINLHDADDYCFRVVNHHVDADEPFYTIDISQGPIHGVTLFCDYARRYEMAAKLRRLADLVAEPAMADTEGAA